MKKKLLIVDDEEVLCNSLKTYLSLSGYEVKTAQDSTQAFKLIEEFRPELMLLDLYLTKGLSGIQILEKVKSTHPDLKVIMLTGFDKSKETEDECHRLGAVKFLCKPLTAADIKKELDTVS